MKKKLFLAMSLAMGLFVVTSCSDDDNDGGNGGNPTINSNYDLAYSAENATAWGNYMVRVAELLRDDAATLYADWNSSYNGGASYASIFKSHNNDTYGSALSCIEEIIDGCVTIADEVGDNKLGEPYDLYMQGNTTEALYAVESWYSWHSRDDYTNNIWSIRNAYFGSLDSTVNANSISALVASVNTSLDEQMKTAILNAAAAIQAIPQPLRNNINSNETLEAMEACADLSAALSTLKKYIQDKLSDNAALEGIIDTYVDDVILPTYQSLKEKNSDLYDAVVAFRSNPSNAAFETACHAWIEAREPWEKSEAFLFGPVNVEGLDPNMDSWPLDVDAIVQILTTGNFGALDWDDDSEAEAAQSVRGFHTLEFLLFQNGAPRTIE